MTKTENLQARALGFLSFKRVSGVYVLVALFILFSIWIPDLWLTRTTWIALASEQAVTATVALGLTVALAAGVFDLAVGAAMGVASATVATLCVEVGWDPLPAALVGLGTGFCIGLLNSLVVVKFRVDSFVATLGMSAVLFAMLLKITDNQQIVGLPTGFLKISSTRLAGIPVLFVVTIGVAIVLWYVMECTPLGRYIEATGGNAEAARLAGVKTARMTIVAFVVSGVVAAGAGIMLLIRTSAASPTTGSEYLLPAFAAASLGATQFRPGRYNIWGTILAVYILAVGIKGLQLVGVEPWVTQLFYGAALIAAVSLANLERRQRVTKRGLEDDAPREGQGHPGARRRVETDDPQTESSGAR